jgi:hypothetical protein
MVTLSPALYSAADILASAIELPGTAMIMATVKRNTLNNGNNFFICPPFQINKFIPQCKTDPPFFL